MGCDLLPLLQLARLGPVQGAGPRCRGWAPSQGMGCLLCLCVQHLGLLRESSARLACALLWHRLGTSGKCQLFMEPCAALGLGRWLVSFPTCREGRRLGRAMGKLAWHWRELCSVVRSFQSF